MEEVDTRVFGFLACKCIPPILKFFKRVQKNAGYSIEKLKDLRRKIGDPRLWFMNRRAGHGEAYVPTDVEHLANVVTHGLWILPSLLGLYVMVQLARDGRQEATAYIYGLAVLLLFSTSTTFHTISYSGKCRAMKNFFHIGDRAVIYIFIAASYTPWLVLKEYEGWGNWMMYVVWTAAVLGITYQYTFHEQYKWLETLLYLVIGVCPSIVIITMKDHSGLYELAMGGAVYISGVVFFKLDGIIPFAHAIWHCFVFIGVTFHYCAVCKYLLGAKIPMSDVPEHVIT